MDQVGGHESTYYVCNGLLKHVWIPFARVLLHVLLSKDFFTSLTVNFRRGSSQYQDFRGWHMTISTISFRWRGIYFTMLSQRSSYCRVSRLAYTALMLPLCRWRIDSLAQAATRAKKHASCFLASINIDEPLYWQIIGIGHSWLWSPHKKCQKIMEPSMWRDHHLAQGLDRDGQVLNVQTWSCKMLNDIFLYIIPF